MKQLIALGFLLIAGCAADARSTNEAASTEQCVTEEERLILLSLDNEAFDQDIPDGGWRGVANRSGCEIAAADLIREYRELHDSTDTIIFWHEGQMRAMANQTSDAIALFERARKPVEEDLAGWNEYVDASIAFLNNDMQALLEAREALAAVEPPPEFELKDGAIEIATSSGEIFKVSWPFNLDMVDGFITCFDKDYRAAYGGDNCRSASPE